MSEVRRVSVEYRPSPTACAFHAGLGNTLRMLMGPIGSGKSTTVCWDIANLCSMVPADKDGMRRMRTAFVRNTLPQLLETTKRT